MSGAEGPDEVRTITSTRDQLSDASSHGALLQWVLRFCQAPETFLVFTAWARSIWPECPYSDADISEDLIKLHDLVGVLFLLLPDDLRLDVLVNDLRLPDRRPS